MEIIYRLLSSKRTQNYIAFIDEKQYIYALLCSYLLKTLADPSNIYFTPWKVISLVNCDSVELTAMNHQSSSIEVQFDYLTKSVKSLWLKKLYLGKESDILHNVLFANTFIFWWQWLIQKLYFNALLGKTFSTQFYLLWCGFAFGMNITEWDPVDCLNIISWSQTLNRSDKQPVSLCVRETLMCRDFHHVILMNPR